MKAREVVQYQDSSNPKVAKQGIQVKTGRKWRAEKAVKEADARLQNTQSHAGLGSYTPQMSRGEERHFQVQDEVRTKVKEAQTCKVELMKQQGAWLR